MPILGLVQLGVQEGTATLGVLVTVNKKVASGTLEFTIKNKTELWVKTDIKSIVGGVNGSYRILNPP